MSGASGMSVACVMSVGVGVGACGVGASCAVAGRAAS